jgi:hypothetical protein
MRILVTILTVLLLENANSFAQAGVQNWATASGINDAISIFDKDGQPFTNPSTEEVSGSPFFLADWKYGALRLHDSAAYANIRLRLNLVTQEVHFLNKNNVEMSLPKGFIIALVLRDSATGGVLSTYTFRCGFPPIDNQDRNNFYRILADGKLTLIESVRKVVSVEKNELSGEEKKNIRDYTDYYLFSDGVMKRMKKDKASVLALLADKKDKVEAWATSGKLNFKSIDDIGRIIAYYNGLP